MMGVEAFLQGTAELPVHSGGKYRGIELVVDMLFPLDKVNTPWVAVDYSTGKVPFPVDMRVFARTTVDSHTSRVDFEWRPLQFRWVPELLFLFGQKWVLQELRQ